MNLKPAIKPTNNKIYLNSWIVEKFPENYKEMNYLDPFVGAGDILLYKEKSLEEVINDKEEEIINIWWAMRDENKNFCSRLKKIKCTKESFSVHSKKNHKDYISKAVSDFFLRQISAGGLKKTIVLKKNKIKTEDYFDFEKIKIIGERIKDIFILNMNPIDLISSFDSKNTFVYCDIPSIKNTKKITVEEHVEIGEILNNFRGKVMIKSQNNSTYKRIYKNFNRKSLPKQKDESIWFNY